MNDWLTNIFLIDVPEQPGKPTIEGYGATHCDLSWKIPTSNGGSTITEYRIEYMVSNTTLKFRYCISPCTISLIRI